MEIVIACGAMNFGADTLTYKSLGGSETAALMLGKELAKRGHKVRMFCNLPAQGQPDYIPNGTKHADGVRYCALETIQSFAISYPIDLFIAVRDPTLAAMPTLARKKVLWMHDIATKRGMKRAFDQMAWTVDEVWTVSEWHRQQIHEATDFPLSHIKALRNGIVPVKTIEAPRSKKQLIYASRPERGLDNLIMPGGVMEHLPDYNLVVCMYDHFPENMRDYYQRVFARMKEMPNVEFLGPKPQAELRQLIRDSAAYIYPTQFEETSCIIARECIEQRTPFFTTRTGALPETLGDCGVYFEDWLSTGLNAPIIPGTPEWCKKFAEFVKDSIGGFSAINTVNNMERRTDLYWGGVAELVEEYAEPDAVTPFSRMYSLIQDGDVIAARAYYDWYLEESFKISGSGTPYPMQRLAREIDEQYPFILPEGHPKRKTMAEYYEWVYTHKAGTDETELRFIDDVSTLRHEAIVQQVGALPPGSRVLEYGCGCGHLLAGLARRFPQIDFVGVDISPAAVSTLNNGAKEKEYANLRAYQGQMSEGLIASDDDGSIELYENFDALILSEVLEHVEEPWLLTADCEKYIKKGGRVIITTPYGPWDILTFRQQGKFHERAHIWHLDGVALNKMFEKKSGLSLCGLPVGIHSDGRQIGNTLCVYEVDHQSPTKLDPLAKAFDHIARQTCVACVIALNNEDTILKMLNSMKDDVQWVNIALGPSTDGTLDRITEWFDDHRWIGYTIIDVPQIEPYKFGFDDARNASTRGAEDFDWFLWIDTDEYLSGNFSKFLRNNMLQGYVIPQHHFTCQPRGGEMQIDRPARLLRTGAGYTARGHIHEHFEVGESGVGRCFMLPDVDIGHTGYVNEQVRRDRFARNFPFLEWDHSLEKKRTLHYFLWFRDIIHRMRQAQAHGDMAGAHALAQEAITYYNDNWQSMASFGQGYAMSLSYLSEVYQALGIGVPIKFQIGVDDQQAQLQGRFESYEQFERVLRTMLEPEFKERLSRYW